MAIRTYAVKVTAYFFDDIVEESLVPTGRVVEIGRTQHVSVPIPGDADYFASVSWKGADHAVVTSWDGVASAIRPGDKAEVSTGPLRLEFELVLRYALRRSAAMWWVSMAALALFFVAAANSSVAGEMVWSKRCEWVPAIAEPVGRMVKPRQPSGWLTGWLNQRWLYCPSLVQQQGGGESGGEQRAPIAEYLQRLLNEDLEGEEQGYVADLEAEAAGADGDKEWVPAGSQGPTDKLGGAANVSPEPVRTPQIEEQAAASKKPAPDSPDVLSVENGTPIPSEVSEEPESDDALVEAEIEDDSTAEEKDATPPAEEEEGWGVPDWYDEEDAVRDARDIQLMLEIAKRRVAIDPEDVYALSVLSYYQYLAMDLDAAEGTYDKIIELTPEEGAGYNNKALIYKRRGNYTEEEALYRVALELEPGDLTTLNNLAVNLGHQGRYDEALSIMDELLLRDPADAYAHLHRAKIHAMKGDDAMALHYLELALEGMSSLDTLHHIEFRQDIRVDPSFDKLRRNPKFRALLWRYYGDDTPVPG